MTENMMSQSVRHESEISKLRESETDALKRLNELLIEKDGDLGKAEKKRQVGFACVVVVVSLCRCVVVCCCFHWLFYRCCLHWLWFITGG